MYQTYDKEWSQHWFQFILDHPEKPWSYWSLGKNPNVTWDTVQANPDLPWVYQALSMNPNITWDIVQANPDKPWDYGWLSCNPNITWAIVQANPDKKWDYRKVSCNPNITWEIVWANPDKDWDYGGLCTNSMHGAKDAFIRKRMQDAFTRSALKEELCQYMFHPRNMCKWVGWGFDFVDVEDNDGEKTTKGKE